MHHNVTLCERKSQRYKETSSNRAIFSTGDNVPLNNPTTIKWFRVADLKHMSRSCIIVKSKSNTLTFINFRSH